MEQEQNPVAGESIEEAPQPKWGIKILAWPELTRIIGLKYKSFLSVIKYGYNSKFSSKFKVKNILQKKIPSKEDLESLNQQAEPTKEETKTDRKSGKFGRYFLSCLQGLITIRVF